MATIPSTRPSLWKWFKTFFTGKPHFYIGGVDNPYMLRWYLIPRNNFLNIYLHKFMRDDDDRALHDHPWWFLSFMLKGSYKEWTTVNGSSVMHTRSAPSVAFRRAEHRHRVELLKRYIFVPMYWPALELPIPCWTIVITGWTCRTWGFWCPKGFVPWHEFVDSTDESNVGKGCGERD